MKTPIKIIIGQVMFLMIAIAGIYLIYPRAEVDINGNFVKINSINAKVIMISENPDFTNPRYIDTENVKNISLEIKPGTYYWKSDNGIIESFSNKFTVNSEVGMKINRTENESGLINVGNVKINVAKGKDGVMVGRIILDTGESEKIEDRNESYTGRQA
jgi:hypothetical protein